MRTTGTDRKSLLALGASIGGVNALETVLGQLPADSPATVVVQHIPGRFSRSLTESLNRTCAITVKEAQNGALILPGTAYVAPGDQHLQVTARDSNYYCRVLNTEPVRRHRPSVDVLFTSVATSAARHAVGVLLTGMGKDGATGLLKIREAGGATIAQDESTSVVWGMPGAAVSLGAVDEILPLPLIPVRVKTLLRVADTTPGTN